MSTYGEPDRRVSILALFQSALEHFFSVNGRMNEDWNFTSAHLSLPSPSLLKLQHEEEKQPPFLQEGARNYLHPSLGSEYVHCSLIILALLFHKKIKNVSTGRLHRAEEAKHNLCTLLKTIRDCLMRQT